MLQYLLNGNWFYRCKKKCFLCLLMQPMHLLVEKNAILKIFESKKVKEDAKLSLKAMQNMGLFTNDVQF